MKDINLDKIKELGYEYEILEENVLLVKNFLTEEECEYFTNYARSRSKEEWEHKYMEGIRSFVKRTYNLDSIEESNVPVTEDWYDKVIELDREAVQDLLPRAMAFFDESAKLKGSSFSILQRQYTGSELRGHYDKFVDTTVEYAAVVYPNDDYTEGEFYFREKGLSLRPPKGSILIFPSSEEYWHGVKAVGDGPDRYAMPAFIHNESWNH